MESRRYPRHVRVNLSGTPVGTAMTEQNGFKRLVTGRQIHPRRRHEGWLTAPRLSPGLISISRFRRFRVIIIEIRGVIDFYLDNKVLQRAVGTEFHVKAVTGCRTGNSIGHGS